MLFELIFFPAIGLLLAAFGLLIWRKQKVTLIHDYHWKNVRKSDLPAYTRLMGIGLCVMGAGVALTGPVNYVFKSQKGLWCFVLGFAAGLIVMNKAQKKYNGSWF